MILLKEQERLCRQLDNLDGLATSLANQALIVWDRRDLEGALSLFREQERLCRQLGTPAGLARSLLNQAELLASELARPLEAWPLVEEMEQLARTHDLGTLTPIIWQRREMVGSRLQKVSE